MNHNESTFATYYEPVTVTLEDIIEAIAVSRLRFPVKPVDRLGFWPKEPMLPEPEPHRIHWAYSLSRPRPMSYVTLDLVGDEPTTLERVTQSLAFAGFWDALEKENER